MVKDLLDSGILDKPVNLLSQSPVEPFPYDIAPIPARLLPAHPPDPLKKILGTPHNMSQPGWELYPHIDHVIPLSAGGHDALENVKLAHAKCNHDKELNSRLLSRVLIQ